MESWLVAAHHLQDDASETARLQLRFKDIYLLVEVGEERGMSEENANDDKEEEGGSGGRDATDQAMDMVAYALVSLADETVLLDLFNSQSTPLHFVDREDGIRCLPHACDRFVRVSVMDFAEKRVVKLGEGGFYWDQSLAGVLEETYFVTASCQFECFDKMIEFIPSFEEVASTSGEDDDHDEGTVQLYINCVDGAAFDHSDPRNL